MQSRKISHKTLMAMAVTGALAGPTVASAQQQSMLLEEMIVTAQKREQNAQDVGISITAYTGDQLDQLGFRKSSDIATLTPGVHVGGNLAGQNLQFTIRGVAQNDFNDHTESPVAVYIDDTYVGLAQGQRFAMYDLERVEVLKGPQGTLFGRNATGGLAHFVSRRPGDELNGYVLAEYGDYDRIKVEGAVGGPLTEAVRGRLSGTYREQDNYLDNHYDPTSPQAFNPSEIALSEGTGDDFGGAENIAVRGQLEFDIGEKGLLWLSANYAEDELATSPYQSEPTVAVLDDQGRQREAIDTPSDFIYSFMDYETGEGFNDPNRGGFGRPVPGGDATGYIDRDGLGLDYTEGDYSFDDLNTMETYGLTARLDWEFGEVDFVSITDYKDFDKDMGMDVDSAPMNQLSFWVNADVDQVSQEFRFSGATDDMRWVTGFYYLNIDYENYIGFKALDNSPLLLPPGSLPADYPGYVDQETTNYSIFGQIDYDLTEHWTLTAGLRVMEEEKEYAYDLQVREVTTAKKYANGTLFGNFSDVTGKPFGVPTKFDDDTSDTLWAGKLQLDYRPTDDLLLYAGINRGVKAGGFNAPIDFGDAQLNPNYEYGYDEEVLTSYEIGFKSTLSDGLMRFNGSFYYYDYEDYQGFVFAGVSGNVVNYDSTVIGGELELIAAPVSGLDLIFTLGYIDAEVEDVEVAPGVFEDTEPSYVPPLTASVLARYAWQVGSGELAIQADASYRDNAFYTLRNYDSHEMDSYTLVNGRVAWTTGDGAWELAAFMNNITDEENEVMGFDISLFCGCSEIAVGEPQWWGISARRNF